MEKYLTKSNITTTLVVLLLFGYVAWLYYNVQKEKEIFVIGMCAKDQTAVWRFPNVKNADDMKLELKKDDGLFYKYFKRCEQEYRKSPKAMKLKYLND
jgi:hypothetical protein